MTQETDDSDESPKKIFDRFDTRGTYLSELLIFVKGSAVVREALAAHGIRVVFVPKKRFEARWFAKNIYLLPELPQEGCWFVDVDVRGWAELDEAYWTLRFARAPDDEVPEDVREHAFPGAFPANLPELLQLGQIDGLQDPRIRARYFTRRDRIPSTVDAIAPWFASPPPPGRFFPRQTTWDVAGYPALTQLALEETDYEGAVWLKPRGDLRIAITAETPDAIDAALWADVTTFLAASDRGIVRTDLHEPA